MFLKHNVDSFVQFERYRCLAMETKPFVIKNALTQWPASKWTPEILSDILKTKQLRFRIGVKNHKAGTILFENQCKYRMATVAEFLNWLRGVDERDDVPFKQFDPSSHFIYLDYQYMFDIFDNEVDLKAVDWNLFGLNRDGLESTLWMGTSGAYTPCHYDTYGFNLVAQVYGRKRWAMFPPEDSQLLNPTRLPYEESSVFANVDLLRPSSIRFLTSLKPKTIILEAGDLLYVPHQWWHFVQCLDDGCISINTWVDMECDKFVFFSYHVLHTHV